MRQIIPIPADQVAGFDVTIDVAIRPKASWDDSRAWTRLRVPLAKVVDFRFTVDDKSGAWSVVSGQALMKSVAAAIGALLEQGIVFPEASDGR